MLRMISFREDRDKPSAIRFVQSYRPKKWLRREKISYCLSADQAEDFTDGELLALASARIMRDYPRAVIMCDDYSTFMDRCLNNRFWLIGRWNDDDKEEFYCGNDRDGKPEYTTDLNESRFSLSESSVNETLRTIRKSTRDRVYKKLAFLTIENGLLAPCMMIVCASKRTGDVKYFAREECGRLRLVKTSDAATKYDYDAALRMFEYLTNRNKHFYYSVLPVFKHNVHARDIENYMRENKVSRMIVLDLQLKFLNRGQ